MIEILNEKRVGAAGREDADRLRRHRPLRQPLHRRAEAVGAAEHQMVGARFGDKLFHCRPSSRHLAVGKTRIFGFDDAAQMRRQRRCHLPADFLMRSFKIPPTSWRMVAAQSMATDHSMSLIMRWPPLVASWRRRARPQAWQG